jgi:hypothetical protein
MSLKDVKKKCEDVFVRALAKIVLQHIRKIPTTEELNYYVSV